MFERLLQQPWAFADGTFLETFQHDRTAISVYRDNQSVFAFGIKWPVPESPEKTYYVSWHRDHGLRSDVATPGPDPDLGHVEPYPRTDYDAIIEVVQREGAGLPANFRDTILDVLRRRI
jgi:hypothetical protein